ncbi:MAG: PaREP1 family protein [Vulcanisaeta sp.]|uniref:PaREP1 family protein n=1 Tax=Vulcanisaeta sp. TaxID=2020871 RepID=UPI003D09C8C9
MDIDYVIDALVVSLNIDPSDAAKAHAELALVMFGEGLGFVDRGDVVQASEKLYKSYTNIYLSLRNQINSYHSF